MLTFVYMRPVRMAPTKCRTMYRQLCPCMKMDTPRNSPTYSTAKQAMAAYATLLSLHTTKPAASTFCRAAYSGCEKWDVQRAPTACNCMGVHGECFADNGNSASEQ